MPTSKRHFAICILPFADRYSLGQILISLIVLWASGCGRKSAPEIVYVGHVASFSGPDKQSGEHAKQGIQIALEEEEGTEGTIHDRRVEVIHVEESAAARLAIINRVAFLMAGTDSAQAAALEPVARSYEIPLVASGGLPGPDSEFVFHTGLSPTTQAETLAEFAGKLESPPIQRIAILSDGLERAASGFLAEKFTKKFVTKKGSYLAGEWTYRELHKVAAGSEGEWEFKKAEDLKEIMEQVRRRKPDAIFLAGAASDLPRLRKSGLDEKLPVFFAGEEGSERELKAAASSQPVFVVTAFVLNGDALQHDFMTEYEKRFKELPDVHAALAYDNMRILIDVLKRTMPQKGRKLKEAIEEMKDFQTLNGKISFSKDGHWANRTAFVVRVQDGKSRVLFPHSQ